MKKLIYKSDLYPSGRGRGSSCIPRYCGECEFFGRDKKPIYDALTIYPCLFRWNIKKDKWFPIYVPATRVACEHFKEAAKLAEWEAKHER